MMPQFAIGSPLLESVWAGGLLILSVLVAWLVLVGLGFVRRKL